MCTDRKGQSCRLTLTVKALLRDEENREVSQDY